MTPDHVEVEILKVLEQMEMTSAFTDVLHVANLTTGSHLMSILTQSDAFSKVGCAQIQKSETNFLPFRCLKESIYVVENSVAFWNLSNSSSHEFHIAEVGKCFARF